MKIVMTGGCGFIGSHFGDLVLGDLHNSLINIDKRTDISNTFLADLMVGDPRYTELICDICDDGWKKSARDADVIVHFAAESHVDKSLTCVNEFIQSNVAGTANIALFCIENKIPMIFVSTDEVYGQLGSMDAPFTENSPVSPRNPYSATKTSAEFILTSLKNVHPEFNCIITRCSNNFGIRQDSTKFIPVCIRAIREGRKIPVYGSGEQVRDWIHVEDHCQAIYKLIHVLLNNPSDCVTVYNIGADNEISNIDLVRKICDNMEIDVDDAVCFVEDPRSNAHDFRYAIDSKKLQTVIEWTPRQTHPFDTALKYIIEEER